MSCCIRISPSIADKQTVRFETSSRFGIRDTQEEEKLIVVEELAKLRRKFKKMDQLVPYDRKKYILKLLYISMLGYECDVGHAEAVGLISQPKYAEKQVGYMVTSVILNEENDFCGWRLTA